MLRHVTGRVIGACQRARQGDRRLAYSTPAPPRVAVAHEVLGVDAEPRVVGRAQLGHRWPRAPIVMESAVTEPLEAGHDRPAFYER
jgi:hypothetical protein